MNTQAQAYASQVWSNPGRSLTGIIVLIAAVLLLPWVAFKSIEHLDANQFMVVQYPSGSLAAFTDPGWKPQWWGTCQKYDRSFQHWFSAKENRGAIVDESIKVRFNDGGHAQISGSVRVDLPTDPMALVDLFRTYHTQVAIQQALVDTVIEKSVYMSGPLMSSKESFAERRNELISLIEDQAMRGVYQTSVVEEQIEDPIATASAQAQAVTASLAKPGLELVAPVVVKKWVKATHIKTDMKSGQSLRQEPSPLERFRINLSNLAINEIKYDGTVEAQINQQQQAIMEVQTAIAQARKSEQAALTAKADGEAAAAKSKWSQEEVKAKAVVQANQEKEVMELGAQRDRTVRVTKAQADKEAAEYEKQAAELRKQAVIAEGEGRAEAAKLTMQANGALEQKLAAYQTVMGKWADSFASYKGALVPSVVMTGAGSIVSDKGPSASNGVGNLIDLLTVKTAKDLGLDMSMQATARQADDGLNERKHIAGLTE